MKQELAKFSLLDYTTAVQTKEQLDEVPLKIVQQVFDCIPLDENTDYRIVQGLQAVSDYQNDLITLDQLKVKKNAALFAAQDEGTSTAYMIAALTQAVYIHDYTLTYNQIEHEDNEIDPNFKGYTPQQALESQKYATRAVYRHTDSVLQDLGNTALGDKLKKYLKNI